MKRPIVVYHFDCHDGVTALWAALQAYPDAEPYAGRHEVAPDIDRVRGRDVVVVDFCWKRAPMLEIAGVANSVLVIDHHKSAQVELEGIEHPCLTTRFDMERSGAGLTWDTLHPNKPRPPLVDYVEDGDLWRFALDGCREVHAACSTYPKTLEMRDMLMQRPIQELIEEGRPVVRYNALLVADAAQHAKPMCIMGHNVPALHHPNRALQSEIAGVLAEGHPFACVYRDRADGMTTFSLRSPRGGGADVSQIAAVFGGGGHARAAGFTIATGDKWRLVNGVLSQQERGA